MGRHKIFTILILTAAILLSVNQQGLGRDQFDEDPGLFITFLPMILNGDEPEPCLIPPTLLAPANGETIDTLTPTLRWLNVDDHTATGSMAMVASDPDFEDVMGSSYGTGTPGEQTWTLSWNLALGQTYYWRVQLICGEDSSPYSEIWSFTTPQDVEKLPAPTLISPPDGTERDSLPILLTWEAVPGADAYEVKIRNGDVTYPFTVYITQFTWDYAWWLDEWLEWSVSAIGPAGVGESSQWWYFKTPPD